MPARARVRTTPRAARTTQGTPLKPIGRLPRTAENGRHSSAGLRRPPGPPSPPTAPLQRPYGRSRARPLRPQRRPESRQAGFAGPDRAQSRPGRLRRPSAPLRQRRPSRLTALPAATSQPADARHDTSERRNRRTAPNTAARRRPDHPAARRRKMSCRARPAANRRAGARPIDRRRRPRARTHRAGTEAESLRLPLSPGRQRPAPLAPGRTGWNRRSRRHQPFTGHGRPQGLAKRPKTGRVEHIDAPRPQPPRQLRPIHVRHLATMERPQRLRHVRRQALHGRDGRRSRTSARFPIEEEEAFARGTRAFFLSFSALERRIFRPSPPENPALWA